MKIDFIDTEIHEMVRLRQHNEKMCVNRKINNFKDKTSTLGMKKVLQGMTGINTYISDEPIKNNNDR